MSEPLIITPTEKQQEFLESTADICLYAGGAGSGKTYALLLDALGLNDPDFGPRIKIPHYRALIFRKQFSMLSDLIDKSKAIYPYIDSGVVYNATDMVWKFSSGAQIQFSYIDSIEDCDKIQGKEFQWCAQEEAGQWNSDKVFRYALSRLRSSKGLQCYYRMTSNPSRFRWLRDLFRINPTGESTEFYVEMPISETETTKKHLQYIQAMLKDNPHLGNEYRAQLYLLSEEDRKALLEGFWNSYDLIVGSVYKNELEEFFKNKRYCRVPYQREFQLYASFDIGRNDNTSIIFFQIVGKEIHVIDSFEDRFQDISYYIAEILKKYDKNVYIILPHDAKQHRIETKNSVYDTVKESFKNVEVLVKYGIEDGIDIARRKFKNIFIDNKNNDRLIECLTNYKRRFNPSKNVYGEPIHDEFSNFSDSFRYMCVFEPEEAVEYISIPIPPAFVSF